ncbi:helix-turn-helix domain-containing protein [Ruegeria sp. PrR005]|uniref:Helix-turn-helix transcriptional regulator n=1 Tax=Ruegeria sp. PrR005 TaxID=2706882 RepID=A0A6B2NPD3_9RHOB|nr:helix-turn-helix transcriptional regulator [Ruegeria sp. PrR005]NDW44389.1 helix-turn-helix transcriptional regulator [Ruegeria sp. PrR005]
MSSDLAKRLRTLQASEGLSIQEMAERCGLSKASLANYLRLKDPQRPGFDAVVAIANGMGVSIDWLAGLAADSTPAKEAKYSDALMVFSVAHQLLVELEQLQNNTSKPIIQSGKVAGKPIWHYSAKTMLRFLEYRQTPSNGTEEDCQAEVDKLVQLLVSDSGSFGSD